jgi:hypothetical protein
VRDGGSFVQWIDPDDGCEASARGMSHEPRAT